MIYEDYGPEYDYDEPRSAHDWEQEARENLLAQWADENPRETAILEGVEDHPHAQRWRIVVHLKSQRETFVTQHLDEEVADLMDHNECESDPHKYYGVSRYEFI